MDAARKYRLAIVASHVIQYQDPFFSRLAAAPEIDLTVLYCSRAGLDAYNDSAMATTLRWDIPLMSGYHAEFLTNLGREGSDFFRHINPSLLWRIYRGNFDAVLFMVGWGSLSPWLGFLGCRASGTPIFLFGDSSFVPPGGSFRSAVRERVMRMLVRWTDAFLVSGTWNEDYYAHYGASREDFFPLPWAIDNDRFANAAALTDAERRALRARFDIGADDVVISYSGKLIPRKDPLVLVEAIAKIDPAVRPTVLFIGDGELRADIEQRAETLGVRGSVRIAGFVNQSEIPRLYAISDVFALPSHFDPRATVVNEAMAVGLPVVLTDRCGPAGDIVADGVNGFIVRPGDAGKLAEVFTLLSTDAKLRVAMGFESKQRISTWNYEAGVAGVVAALRAIRKRAGRTR